MYLVLFITNNFSQKQNPVRIIIKYGHLGVLSSVSQNNCLYESVLAYLHNVERLCQGLTIDKKWIFAPFQIMTI